MPVECNSDESHTPGTFCVKIVKQGPRGFICENEEQYHVNFVIGEVDAIVESFLFKGTVAGGR